MGGAFIAIAIIGLALAVTAYNNTTSALFGQLESDVFGSGSGSGFLVWAGAIIFLSVAGNVLGIPKASKLFIILVLVVFILQQQGLWNNFEAAFTSTTSPGTATAGNTGAAVTSTDTPVATPGVSAAATTAATPATSTLTRTLTSTLHAFGVSLFGNSGTTQ